MTSTGTLGYLSMIYNYGTCLLLYIGVPHTSQDFHCCCNSIIISRYSKHTLMYGKMWSENGTPMYCRVVQCTQTTAVNICSLVAHTVEHQ